MRHTSPVPQPTPAERARFDQKYSRGSGCWEWTAAIVDGYGRFRLRGKTYRAHRLLYVWERPDEDISGVELDHYVCDNRCCIRPEHLRPSTTRENVLRGHSPSAVNSRKTHCFQGHELTPETARFTDRGKRVCRICDREKRARYLERHRERVNEGKRRAYIHVSYEPRLCATCNLSFVPERSTGRYCSRYCQEHRVRVQPPL